MTQGPLSRREFEIEKTAFWAEIRRIREIIEGPPHPGLENRVNSYLTAAAAVKEEQERQHKANRWRLNVIIGLLSLLVGVLAIWHH